MNKEIRKNRKALIRHLILVNDKPMVNRADCAKCRTLEFLGVRNPSGTVSFAGKTNPVPNIVLERLRMNTKQWDDMEDFFEGFDEYDHPHSFAETAYWLQTLPRWPRVL